ncbi:MAG: hypothetical protein HUU46_19260 [Candidatus Hydrogenedentes bacterium]|nr:hypothetical protein [Candidatus Hydrogenedentota bacterium]
MRITLELVRTTLRRVLGRDSFVASFITHVDESAICPTACITKDGRLQISPEFVSKHVMSEQDLVCILLHELMHPMFGHFVYGPGELENVGADMVINATITHVFAEASDNGALFRRFYKPRGIEGLLRPGSQMYESRYADLYESFYLPHSHAGDTLSTGEVIQTLKILTPTIQTNAIVLLGGHGKLSGKDNGTGSLDGLSAEVLCDIAGDLKKASKRNRGQRAGINEALYDLFLEVLKGHLSIKRVLLAKFATKQKVDNFKTFGQRIRTATSPIPLNLSKRDLVLLSAGIVPFHFHNHSPAKTTQQQGLAVYLDVSGSVNEHLPRIIGLLQGLKHDLKSIYLFSNKVVEVPFQTLLNGKLQTTYGTDFNCIAASILERGHDKAVILTDGYAALSDDRSKQLQQARTRTLTVLFGGKEDCPEFALTGDVVQLEDIVE